MTLFYGKARLCTPRVNNIIKNRARVEKFEEVLRDAVQIFKPQSEKRLKLIVSRMLAWTDNNAGAAILV